MLECASCGRRASIDFVAMTDQCPGCGQTPGRELAPMAVEDPLGVEDIDPSAMTAGELREELDRYASCARVHIRTADVTDGPLITGIALDTGGRAVLTASLVGQLSVGELRAELSALRPDIPLWLPRGVFVGLVEANGIDEPVLVPSDLAPVPYLPCDITRDNQQNRR